MTEGMLEVETGVAWASDFTATTEGDRPKVVPVGDWLAFTVTETEG